MHGLDAMESFDYYDEEKHPFVKEILEPLSESEQSISKISEMNVDPRFRGKGIARNIMNTTLKNLKEKHPDAPVFLCAYPSDLSGQNIPLEDLVNFYKSFGFEELGRHQWENGTIEAIMWLSSPSKAKTASDGRLQVIRDLKQKIHGLRNKFPVGIKSIDDADSEKLRRALENLRELESKLQAIVEKRASQSKMVDSIKLVLSAYSSDDPIQSPDPLRHAFSIRAYSGTKEVGRLQVQSVGSRIHADDVWVDAKYRRQGIASAMFDYAEELTGKKAVPSSYHSEETFEERLSDDAQKFWINRWKRQ